MPRGRPTGFKPEYAMEAYSLATRGATKDALAETLGVSRRTLGTWLATHPDFRDAFERGRAAARTAGRSSLFGRAIGLEQAIARTVAAPGGPITVTVTQRRAPEVRACMLWLRNRRPDGWRR